MKHTYTVTAVLVCLFFLSQMIGLGVLNQYVDWIVTEETGEITFKEINLSGVWVERPPIEEEYSFFYILIAIIIATLVVLLIIKFKKPWIWKSWFYLSVVFCLTLAFSAFISGIIAFLAAIILGYLKVFRPGIISQNVTELFVYAGIAVLFVPVMNLLSAVFLLLGISLYDAYAVWKSKHMIKLAKFQTESNVFAGLFIPYKLPKGKVVTAAKKVEKAVPTIKNVKNAVKIRHAILGGGDMAFPLLFAGAVFKTYGLGMSFFIPPFATVALIFLFCYGKKEKFYPAMPFLSLGCFVGLGVMYLFQYLV